MDIILIVLLVLLIGIASSILYLNLKSKPQEDNEKRRKQDEKRLEIQCII